MSLTYSGPGRALQFHLDLFKDIRAAKDYVIANGMDTTRVPLWPISLRQRVSLQTALAPDVVNGDSVAIHRDSVSRVYTEANLQATWQSLQQEYDLLNRATTYYVSAEMADLITQIADRMEPEALYETDLPSQVGLIVLEKPLVVGDLHPKTGEFTELITMPHRSIGWLPSQIRWIGVDESGDDIRPGIVTMNFVDEESYTAIYIPSLKRNGFIDEEDNELEVHRQWKVEHSGWSFGTPWQLGGDVVYEDDHGDLRRAVQSGKVHRSVDWQRRWMLAFFRLTFQRILVPQKHVPNRVERKWFDQVGRPLEDGYIKVVRLRREVDRDTREKPETEFDNGDWYTRRFIVEGHWRRQHYPTMGLARNEDGSFNHDSHRLIWIEPFIKGPDHAPLVVGQQVQALVR